MIVEKPVAGGSDDVEILMLSKQGNTCIHDVILSGTKLDADSINRSLSIANSIREVPKPEGSKQRFVVNHINSKANKLQEGH
jgi:hypothetical protein